VTEKKKQNFVHDNPTSGLKSKAGIISLRLCKATKSTTDSHFPFVWVWKLL